MPKMDREAIERIARTIFAAEKGRNVNDFYSIDVQEQAAYRIRAAYELR